MKDIEKKLVALLSDEAIEKQMAAAIILGELDLKSAPTLDALAALCASPLPPLRKHALRATLLSSLDTANAEDALSG